MVRAMETITISPNRTLCRSCKGEQTRLYPYMSGGPRRDVCDGCLGMGTVPTADALARFTAARASGMTFDEAYDLIR